MNKYRLAIPVISVLACASVLPAYPQSNPDTPQTPPCGHRARALRRLPTSRWPG